MYINTYGLQCFSNLGLMLGFISSFPSKGVFSIQGWVNVENITKAALKSESWVLGDGRGFWAHFLLLQISL